MVKRRLGIVILVLCFCLLAMPIVGQAESIDLQQDCTLTITYSCDGVALPGQTVVLYHIAEVSADFVYTLTPGFATSGLRVNGIKSQSQWNTVRSTLEAVIVADAVQPLATAVTDEAGNAVFAVKPGLYLVWAVHTENAYFDSALVGLPGTGVDGLWQYQVSVSAKGEMLPPIEPDEKVEYRVVKLWQGDAGEKDRPQSVTVEIFRNDVSCETVTLSRENDWTYAWSAADDGAVWTVVERNVPAGYTMTVSQRDTAFMITNTQADPTPKPPQTGDTANILLYAVLMFVSGSSLILLGLTGKRKLYEETKEI